MTFVELVNNVPRASTLVIAEGMEIKHRAILELIDRYEERFIRLGAFTFETEKSGGRPTRLAWLNEEQTVFVCSLMRNSERVVNFKERLASDFVKMKNALLEIKSRQQSSDWLEKRKSGKISRIEETDIIKEFVKYAEGQGSKSASMYYMNISRMENKALFILESKFKNVRDMLDGQQLATLSTCDQLVAKTLRDCMVEGMHYKEIYKEAKRSVERLVELIGMSGVQNSKPKSIGVTK